MENFLQQHEGKIIGNISGFDRLVLRGTLRLLSMSGGLFHYLYQVGVLLKEFGAYVEQKSAQLKAASLAEAHRLGREVRYLPKPGISKEAVALEIAHRDGIERGLIGVLTAVEPCQSFEVRRNREKKELELVPRIRKCLFLYHYWIDEELGFMGARIQSWFPFTIQVWLNGREWLSRQLDGAGIGYQRRDNTFVWIDDVERAQELMGEQLQSDWVAQMKRVEQRLNPQRAQLLAPCDVEYYWSVHQSEWATDVMFESPQALAKIYPSLVRGAIGSFSSPDVLRFLGKRLTGRFDGEVLSHYRERPEGVRVKHTVKQNSVKVYDKQTSVLRVETTLNDVRDFKAFDTETKHGWRPMRKGVSDIYRRAEVSQASNERYLEALAALGNGRKVLEVVQPVCRSTRWKSQRIRGLRPWSEQDRTLLQVIARGEFAMNGVRNSQLVARLHPGAHTLQQRRQLSRQMTTRIRMLRAHGLLHKVPGTHRYVLSEKGREVTTAILVTQNASVERVAKMAA